MMFIGCFNARCYYCFYWGYGGNSIATTATFAALTNVFGGDKLASGDDCTQTEAKTALLALDGEGTNLLLLLLVL